MPTAPPTSRDAALEARVFWLKFKNQIALALLIALLGIGVFAGYRFYLERRNSTAAALLSSAKTPQDYQQVIAQHPDTPAAVSAHLLLAEAQRADKQFTDANVTLQTFVNKHPEHDLVATARMAMAANLESMGRADEALSIYQQVAATYPKNYNAPFALLSQARLLKAKNRVEDARRIYEAMITQYRDSIATSEAAGHLRSIRASAPSRPPVTSTTAAPTGPTPPPLLARPPAPAPAPAKAPSAAPSPAAKKPKN